VSFALLRRLVFASSGGGSGRHLLARLRLTGGRSLAQVKTLLGASDADHGDACGHNFPPWRRVLGSGCSSPRR
jgi:hypothetical protein